MSRWTVYKAGRYAWTAHCKGDLPGKLFPTWREAMDYADRMARTREVVLPRGMYMPANDLRRLALALLALADQENA